MASASSMTLKDWVDLFTGGGAAISAIAAGVAAWASRTSAKAAEQSGEAAREAVKSNERIADNDRRIRLMEERMKIWRAYDDLMSDSQLFGEIQWKNVIGARVHFQHAPFIFPGEVDDFLREFSQKAIRQEWVNKKLKEYTEGNISNLYSDEEVTKWRKEKQKLDDWFARQHDEGMALFKKHMSLIG